jgi:hypothetical protein
MITGMCLEERVFYRAVSGLHSSINIHLCAKYLLSGTCNYTLAQLFVQGDQKVSVNLMITIQKVTSNVQVSPASLQTFIDTPNCVLEDRVKYSMSSTIPNSNCIIMVSD